MEQPRSRSGGKGSPLLIKKAAFSWKNSNTLLSGEPSALQPGVSVSSFQVSMMQREREERLEGNLFFWGKIEGIENDYLVCFSLATPKLEEGDFPLKKVNECSKTKQNETCSPFCVEVVGGITGSAHKVSWLALIHNPCG